MVSARKGSEVLARINEKWPLPHLRHLKRIRKMTDDLLQIILDDEAELSDCQEWLDAQGIEYSQLLEVEVPACPPMSKEQHSRWCSIWPVSYHEPMTERVKPTALAEMQRIIDLNRDVIATLSDHEVLLIEEATGAVVLRASANREHPLGHACMEAIRLHESVSYLCMGMILIKRSEPCLMCSMALVHSRIAAVCFIDSDPLRGGLGGQIMLPRQPGINHRFPVYRIDPFIE